MKDLGSKEANITIPDIQRDAMWEKAQGPCKRHVYLKWLNCHELLADLYAAVQNTVIKRIFLSLSHVWLFAAPWTGAHHAPLSMEFSRKEYWSGLPFPSPGDLPRWGIEPGFPELQAVSCLVGGFFTDWVTRKAPKGGAEKINIGLWRCFNFCFSLLSPH